jgi:hypothetical protein
MIRSIIPPARLPAMIRGRRLGFALVVLVFSITVGAFMPALQGQFLNWDDGLLFTKNLDYRGLGLMAALEPVPLLRITSVQKPDALDLRRYLVQALEGQARALRAQGRGGEAETLLAEVRAVSAVSPETESRPAPQP